MTSWKWTEMFYGEKVWAEWITMAVRHLEKSFSFQAECPVLYLVAQLCLTLCDPMDYSPSGFCVHGMSQARILESCHFLLHTAPSVWFSSVAQSCPALCDPMNHSTPGLPVHHHLPEFTQTHVHRVSDAIQPSHPLSSPSSPAPNPSQHQSCFTMLF